MKALTLLASPRKKGNTARALDWAEDELRSLGCETRRIELADLRVEGCRACGACQEKGSEFCSCTDDDANDVFRAMEEADLLLFAFPLYCWSFPGPLKCLFDRGFCLVRWDGGGAASSRIEGRRAAMLVTCGGPVEDNADLVPALFERICRFTLVRRAGELVLPFCRDPGDLEPAAEEKARRLARSLARGA